MFLEDVASFSTRYAREKEKAQKSKRVGSREDIRLRKRMSAEAHRGETHILTTGAKRKPKPGQMPLTASEMEKKYHSAVRKLTRPPVAPVRPPTERQLKLTQKIQANKQRRIPLQVETPPKNKSLTFNPQNVKAAPTREVTEQMVTARANVRNTARNETAKTVEKVGTDNLKNLGLAAGGLAVAGGAIVGAKMLHDRVAKNQKKDSLFSRWDSEDDMDEDAWDEPKETNERVQPKVAEGYDVSSLVKKRLQARQG